MKRLNKIFMSLLLVLLTLAFVSCGGNEEEVIDDTQAEATVSFEGTEDVVYGDWEIGKKGGRVVIPLVNDPKTLNNNVTAEASSSDVTYRMYEELVRRSQQTIEWEPASAESWSFSEDQKTITLKVRKGMKWSDGDDLDASDWVFTYNQVLLREDVGSNSRSGLIVNKEPVKVELIDSHTLSITTNTVYAGMLTLSNTYPTPKHVIGPLIGWTEEVGYDYDWEWVKEEQEDGSTIDVIKEIKPEGIDYGKVQSFWGVDTDVTTIVGNGPFIIKEYVAGQRAVLKANPYYYKKDAKGNQLPYLDELVFLFVESQDTQLAKFQAGEADFFEMIRGEDYGTLVGLQEEKGFQIYSVGPRSATQFITFNQNWDATGVSDMAKEVGNNKEFRKAMSEIVDRETIINNIAFGIGYPQYSFVPTFSPYYWDGAGDATLPYNPESAKARLDKLGWKDTDGDGFREVNGEKISLRMITNSGNRVREQMGEMFAQEAKKIGVEVNFQPEDFNTLVGKLYSGNDWDIILIGLTGSADPISGSNVYKSSGNLHMTHPNQKTPLRDWEAKVDAAWDEANNTVDEAQRISGFEKIQRIWVDENPWIYTYNTALMHAWDKELGNIQPRPIDRYNWAGIVEYLYWK